MQKSDTEEERYLRAKKRLEREKEFYRHLFFYILVNLLLFIINIWTSRWYLWCLFPAIGWGVGLAFHAADVFLIKGFFGTQWEKRKIEEYMQAEEDKRRWE